jgi:hypothetical protein
MEHEPGLRWLTGNERVNYHTLADFRVGHKEALDEVFSQLLALLDEAGVVDLNTILVDGTKMKSVGGRASFHGRRTIEKRLRRARTVVQELERRAEPEQEGMDERREAAQRRAAREAMERAEAALQKLLELESGAKAKDAAPRVSESEPEARKMKQPAGGTESSYNVQVATEAQSRMIVSIGVTSDINDTQQLMPTIERVEQASGVEPGIVIADNGYATRSNVEEMSGRGMTLIAPWKDDQSRQVGACVRNGIDRAFLPAAFKSQPGGKSLLCPAGNTLVVIGQRKHHGVQKAVFRAGEADCARCEWKRLCCGRRGGPRRVEKVIESEAMREYLKRMKGRFAKALYKKRCEIAEFPHLWIKGLKNLRRFSVRGLVKTGMEAVWIALAYDVTQWMRLRRQIPAA